MLEKNKTFIAIFDFGKLTKANSRIINTRLVYISKKDYTGTNTKVYIAFDYATKIQLGFASDKDKLVEMLERLITTDAIKELEK